MVFFAGIFGSAAVGGYIGHRLKLPAGGMLGSMVAVVIFNMIFQPVVYLPGEFRVLLQLAFGPMLGSRISREEMGGLLKLAFPAGVIIVSMLGFNILFGGIMHLVTGLCIPTTLFATAPGGMMDMAIISADFGANYVYVALLQLCRIIFILMFMMPFYRKAMAKITTPKDVPVPEVKEKAKVYKGYRRFLLTALCGALLGVPLWLLGVPAGAIVGAMIGAAVFNIVTGQGYFPPEVRLPLQIVAGVFIGLRVDRASIMTMNEILVPLLILMVFIVVTTAATTFIVHKLTGLDIFTSLMASTPGGLSEMAILADALNLDAPKVALLHTARLMTVIIIFPQILALVIWLL